MKIDSSFALLDVREGREELHALLGNAPGKTTVPVTIEAEIEYTWGSDDGVSQEFVLNVTSVTIKEQPDAR